jgi:hypothetical protein
VRAIERSRSARAVVAGGRGRRVSARTVSAGSARLGCLASLGQRPPRIQNLAASPCEPGDNRSAREL